METKKSTKRTLQTIGKVAYVISKIIFILGLIGASIGLTCMISAAFVNWEWVRETIIDFAQQHDLTLTWDVGTLTLKNAEVLSFGVLVKCGSGAVLTYFLMKLFGNIKDEGTPFTDSNVKLLMAVGITCLVEAFGVSLLLDIVVRATQTGAIFNYGSNFPNLIIALLVFALALVFKYGVELQKEADTTL
jgi:hypothetical protein